jgi:hypothetical protein
MDSQTNSSSQPMTSGQKPKNNWLLVVIFFVLGLIVGALAYAGYSWLASKEIAQPLPTPTASVIVSSTSATPMPSFDISDWQTYRDDKYGYEIKFPKDWILQKEETVIKGAGNISGFTGVLHFENRELLGYGYKGDLLGMVRVYSTELPLEQWFEQFMAKREMQIANSIEFMKRETGDPNYVSRSDVSTSNGSVNINGLAGRFSYEKAQKPLYIEGGPDTSKQYYLKNNSWIYDIIAIGFTSQETEDLLKIFDQIANTFKFTK